MGRGDPVLGLIGAPGGSGEPLARKLRDLTIAWSRYGYREAIVERPSVDAVLDEAAARGHRTCLILSPGVLIRESWRGEGAADREFLPALRDWCEKNEFLVVGRLRAEADGWLGLDRRSLLVDVERWQALGAPRFGEASDDRRTLPVAEPVEGDGALRALQPTGREAPARPGLPGWGWIAAALRAGLPVQAFDAALARQLLDLAPSEEAARRLAPYLDDGVTGQPPTGSAAELLPDQRELLDVVALHARNARRGVFLWNIESYGDVEKPPPDFGGPVSTIYSVAAGFKPNRILATHGFDANTRVVFCDYSQRALDVRRFMRDHWDGEDFPAFLDRVFERFPHPETHYHLWGDRTPAQVPAAELEAAWRRELSRWGGPEAFARHYRATRELEHEFVHCDLLDDPSPVLERLSPDAGAVIWWSNAFFTVYANWRAGWSRRRDRYEAWVSELAARNPELLVYGSDHNNTNVNWIRAGDYWRRYQKLPGDELVPRKLQQHEIRM